MADATGEKGAGEGGRSGAKPSIPAVPLAFLGLGVYRAWIEIVFVGSFVDFPAATVNARDLFDISMAVTAMACALLARRFGPFFNKTSAYVLSGATLTASTVLMFLTCYFEDLADIVAVSAALLGGFGIALLILFWSELYGCLNPLRVARYYAGSIVAGALIIYVYYGFKLPWLFVMTSLLPLVSLLCVHHGFESLPEAERPATTWTRFSVPWKAVVLMAIYAFAYGLMESDMYDGTFGPHSSPGVLVVGLLVFLGVTFRGGKFDFGIIYKAALPLVVVALFLLPSLGQMSAVASSICIQAGYTAESILIMLIMANICYRYGVSAVWLFGIERSVRQVAMWGGRFVAQGVLELEAVGVDGDLLISLLTMVMVLVATMVFYSEQEYSSRWGANFIDGGTDSVEVVRKQELGDRCSEVASEHGLTMREEEILLLLAQHKTVSDIEHELFIANGTAKAHVRHIYQKLDIHSRQELFDMLGVDGQEAGGE